VETVLPGGKELAKELLIATFLSGRAIQACWIMQMTTVVAGVMGRWPNLFRGTIGRKESVMKRSCTLLALAALALSGIAGPTFASNDAVPPATIAPGDTIGYILPVPQRNMRIVLCTADPNSLLLMEVRNAKGVLIGRATTRNGTATVSLAADAAGSTPTIAVEIQNKGSKERRYRVLLK
jgi:hypothetical protein